MNKYIELLPKEKKVCNCQEDDGLGYHTKECDMVAIGFNLARKECIEALPKIIEMAQTERDAFWIKAANEVSKEELNKTTDSVDIKKVNCTNCGGKKEKDNWELSDLIH